MKDDFLTNEVARVAGLKPKEVVDASDRGIIKPKIEAAGSGTRRIFSFRNVVQFGIFKTLKTCGFTRPAIKDILHWIDGDDLYVPRIEKPDFWIYITQRDIEKDRLSMEDVQSMMVVDPTVSKSGEGTLDRESSGRTDNSGITIYPEYAYAHMIINLTRIKRRIFELYG